MNRQFPMFPAAGLTAENFVQSAIRGFRAARLVGIWRPTLVEHVRRRGMPAAPALHWLGFLKRAAKHGVSLDELRYSQVRRWLRDDWQNDYVTRRMVLDFLDENGLAIEVVQERTTTLGRPTFFLEDPESPGRWHSTVLTDETGSRYGLQIDRGGLFDRPDLQGRRVTRIRFPNQEQVLTIADGDDLETHMRRGHAGMCAAGNHNGITADRYRWVTLSGGRAYREVLFTVPGVWPIFSSPHHPVPNVLCHLRLTERTGADGQHLLHIEEIQSDWNNPRAGREAPFRRQWPRLALQWCVQEAAARGLAGVSLTPGDIVARRNRSTATAFIERTYRQVERELGRVLPAREGRTDVVCYRCNVRSLKPYPIGERWILVDGETGVGTSNEVFDDSTAAWQATERGEATEDYAMPALFIADGARPALSRRWFDPVGGEVR